MKYIEYILTALLLVNLMARDVIPDTRFDAGILSVGTILVLFYFFGFWWLLKPPLKNFRTISISILYMLACCSWAFSIQFVALFLTGDVEMVILSAILTAVALPL